MSQNSKATRRDFLKTSAGIAASAALAGPLVRPAGAFLQASAEIKIGLIGCGGRGTGACSQALSTKGPVKLLCVADAFEDQARTALNYLKNEHGERVDVKSDNIFVGFDAYKHAIDSGIDLIIIATSPGFRPIHFEYAVEQGKNVFMEKPVGTDAPGIRRVLAANQKAKEKNLKVAVGLQRHHQPPYIETIKRIHDGALGDPFKNGEIELLRVYWNGTTPWVRSRRPEQTEMEYQMRNWYFFTWLCGDHIVEQHIHNLDVANWIKNGPPVKAEGIGGRQVRNGPEHGQIYDHHYVEYTYADGTTMASQCRHWDKSPGNVSEHAHGIKGYSDVSQAFIKLRDGTSWRYRGPNPNPYQVEHDDFFDAVRNNKPYNEGDYGATSTMTAILGRMATYSGGLVPDGVVTWDQAINSDLDLHPKLYDFKADPEVLWPDASVRPVRGPDGRYPIPIPGTTRAF